MGERQIVLQAYGTVVPDTQWSVDFLQGMIDRMHQGYHKYGHVSDTTKQWDFIKTLQTRIERYVVTGNTEWLMDAANFCMMEFMHPQQPNAHYRPTESGESPGSVSQSGNTVQTYKREFHRHEGD